MQLRSVIEMKSEEVVSSEAPLTAPSRDISAEEVEEISAVELENQAEQAAQVPVPQWLVVAKNRRVNRDWELLLSRAPAQATRC